MKKHFFDELNEERVDGLAYVKPQKKYLYLRYYLLCAVLVGFIVSGLVYYLHIYTSDTQVVDTNEVQSSDTISQSQKDLDAIYASDAMLSRFGDSNENNYGLNDSTATIEGISGYLLFSGLYKDSQGTTQVYSFDMKSLISPIYPSLFLPEHEYSAFIEFEDVDNPKDFFLNAIDYNALPDLAGDGRIQKYDVETNSLKTFKSADGTYEEGIAWSQSANRLAYSRLKVEFVNYLDIVSISNKEVVVIDPDTDEIILIIDGATQPKWSPDGSKLLTLKSDGLYMYDFDLEVDTNIIPVTEGQLLGTSMMDVSPDGKYLVLTAGRVGVIALNQIESWEPFVIKELGRIQVANTEYYWPQFSPDSNYYAVQAIDDPVEGELERDNPRFEIRATLGRGVLYSITLSQFDFNALFTDTWVSDLPAIHDKE